MTQDQAPSNKQNRLTEEQETLITGTIAWSIFSVLIPILGIPLTWLLAKKLQKTQKFIVTAIGIAPWILVSNYKPESQPNVVQNPSQPAVTSPRSQTSPSVEIIPIAAWANVKNDRAVRVIGSEVVDQIASGNPFADPVQSKGGQLVIVYIGLKNIGQESGNMFWSRFHLIDNQGRQYDEIEDFDELLSINMWLEEQGLETTSNQMFPGAIVETAKVFRVAPDASNLQLVSNNKLFEIQASRTSAVPDSSSRIPTTELTSSAANQSSRIIQADDGYANLRVQPSTEVRAIAKLPNGTVVDILNEQTNNSGQLWYEIEVSGQTGWIFSGLID